MSSQIYFAHAKTLAQGLRDMADELESGSRLSPQSAVVVLHDHDGISVVSCLNTTTHDAIGILQVGNHILLNAVMPNGNIKRDQT